MASTKETLRLDKEASLRDAAAKGDLQRVKNLLAEGVNPNAVNAGTTLKPSTKRTALHWAAQNGHLEITQELLKAGANPLLEDKNKKTPFQIATAQGHPTVAALLKQALTVENKEIYSRISTVYEEVKTSSEQQKIQLKKLHAQADIFLKRDIASVHTLLNNKLEEYNKLLRNQISAIIFSLSGKSDFELTSTEVKHFQTIVSDRLDLAKLFQRYFYMSQSAIEALKNADSMEDSSTILFDLTSFITENILFRTNFNHQVNVINSYLPEHIKNAKILRQLEKALKKLSSTVTAQQQSIFKSFSQRFQYYMKDVEGFVNFIEKYFPGDLIENITYMPTDILNTSFTQDNSIHLSDEILLKTAEAARLSNTIIFRQLKLYFQDIVTDITKLMHKEAEHVNKYVLIFTKHKVKETDTAYDCILNIINSIIESFFDKVKPENYDLKNCIFKSAMYSNYNFGQKYYVLLSELLKGLKTFPEEVINKKYEDLRRECLQMVAKEQAKAPIDHATQMALDANRTHELKKFKEQKAREDALRQKQADLEKHFHQQKLEEQKRKQEREAKQQEVEKAGFRKLFLSDLNSRDISAIYETLNNSKITLTEKEFLTLIVALRIPGFENIPASRESLPGNSMVFHAGKFYSFTYHSPHGRKDKVDGANIAHLIKLLGSIGIEKDNFEALANSNSEKNKIS